MNKLLEGFIENAEWIMIWIGTTFTFGWKILKSESDIKEMKEELANVRKEFSNDINHIDDKFEELKQHQMKMSEKIAVVEAESKMTRQNTEKIAENLDKMTQLIIEQSRNARSN